MEKCQNKHELQRTLTMIKNISVIKIKLILVNRKYYFQVTQLQNNLCNQITMSDGH